MNRDDIIRTTASVDPTPDPPFMRIDLDAIRKIVREEIMHQEGEKHRLRTQRDELLEALAALVLNIDAGGASLDAMRDARAAIKAVEEGK